MEFKEHILATISIHAASECPAAVGDIISTVQRLQMSTYEQKKNDKQTCAT